jgi:hypothetical protein
VTQQHSASEVVGAPGVHNSAQSTVQYGSVRATADSSPALCGSARFAAAEGG